MRLPDDAIIAPEKITKYLLQWRPENDKSRFLAKAGYEIKNWKHLERDLRKQILPLDATFDRQTVYGDMYQIRGTLSGPNGISVNVITVWMIEYKTQQTKFITLFPDKER